MGLGKKYYLKRKSAIEIDVFDDEITAIIRGKK